MERTRFLTLLQAYTPDWSLFHGDSKQKFSQDRLQQVASRVRPRLLVESKDPRKASLLDYALNKVIGRHGRASCMLCATMRVSRRACRKRTLLQV